MKKKFRIERDSLGEMKIPADAYWGINVGRAIENFPVSRRKVNPTIIEAYCRIKKAAAVINAQAGKLPKDISKAVAAAADEILAGSLRDQFVLDAFQAGAGTSTNMNVNEVLANRALEILGRQKGDYAAVSPNDHVNRGQSTNDTYPTAMRMAALAGLEAFYPASAQLERALRDLGKRHARTLKSGRTHLQDAVPVTLGGEITAYAEAVAASTRHIRRTAGDLLELPIGGSAAGTGMNTYKSFGVRMAAELSRMTGFKLKRARDLQHAMQSQAPIGRVSGALRDFAIELGRIANDLRLLSSGPTTGFAEIRLPAVQAGSSIMPGKINPSIPEMVNMVCFQAIGNDLVVTQAVAAGQMELNVMMPVMAENLLETIEILSSACRLLAVRCIEGIEADADRMIDFAHRTTGLATALNPYIGYLAAARVAKRALAEGKTIIEIVREEKLLSEKDLRRILDPERMTKPAVR